MIPGQMFTKSYGSSFLTDSTCFGTEYQLYACTHIHKGLTFPQGPYMQHLAKVQKQDLPFLGHGKAHSAAMHRHCPANLCRTTDQ